LPLTGAYSPLTNTLTIGNGVNTLNLDLSELDNEATKFAIQGTDLVILSESGAVLAALPLSGVDNQTIQVAGSYSTGFAISIADGNTINIPPLVIPPQAPPTIALSITDTSLGSTITPIVNGVPGIPVVIPDNQALTLGGTAVAPTITIENGNTIALPAYPVPAPSPTVDLSITTSTTGDSILTPVVNGVPGTAIVLPDNQALTLGGTATAPTITIENGNTIALPPYPTPAAAATPTVGLSLTPSPIGGPVLAPIVNGVTGPGIVLPDEQTLTLGGTAVAPTITIENGNTIALPPYPAAIPPIPPTITYTVTEVDAGTELRTFINGVAGTVVTIADDQNIFLGGTATEPTIQIENGNTIALPPYPTVIRIVETASIAGPRTIPQPIVTVASGVETRTIESLTIVDAPGTVTLPDLAALPGSYVGIEFDIKVIGAFAGSVTIAAPSGQLIDGVPTYTVVKTLGVNPNCGLRWAGTTIGWIVV
jgi:hypothetical protein